MARIFDAVNAVANEIIKQKDYLTSLDKAIADGDHGINMARGFTNIQDKITTIENPTTKKTIQELTGKNQYIQENEDKYRSILWRTFNGTRNFSNFSIASNACD